ncbi:hypothetical protein JCM16303_006701 [Sporobolomyces ruberrimus]
MQHNYSSPPFDHSPASISMVRKRTFQDTQPGISSSPTQACDSSPSSLPFHDYHFLSSPETSISTNASSPMSRNVSSQSYFGNFSPSQDYELDASPRSHVYAPFPTFSPTEQQFLPPDVNERPGMKRRKTMPEVHHLSPTSSTKSSRDPTSPFTPRGTGKDGEDVWPPVVEDCFQTALRLLPRLGRKKLIIQGKPCGRNELIADYIYRHTGKMRSRKQVSSHIQVLKNLKKEDEEFMYLVSDPVEGEDRFLPGNAELFFGKRGMGSRHAPPVFLERSLSASNVPYHPPIDLSTNVPVTGLAAPLALAPPPLHPSHMTNDNTLHSPFVMQPSPSSATTPTSGLTRAMQGMTVAVSPSPTPTPTACPIAPSLMNIVAPNSSGEKGHIYARLDAPNGPTRTVFVEDLPMWEKRYGSIPAMNDHLPCQFLHVHLPLSIPGLNGNALDQSLETQVRVTSLQALPLTVVTSIYCHGDSVITYEDTLDPMPLDPSSTSLGHQHFYDAPFGSDFWTMLLRGGHDGLSDSNLRKSAKGRQGLADMLPGFSVIQEFVVPSDHGRIESDGSLSPGSAMGDVVLVVLYDLEVSKGIKAQKGELSFLSLRRSSTASPPSTIPVSQPEYYTSYSHSGEIPRLVMPNEYFHPEDDESSLDTARPTSFPPHKPNLSLHIPPPPRFSDRLDTNSLHTSASQPSPGTLAATGPITPWGQVVHTPTHPPPVVPPPSALADAQRDRSRLEAAWRTNAAESNNRWDLDSPALYAPPPSHPSIDSTNYFGLHGMTYHPVSPRHDEEAGPLSHSNNHSLASYAMDRRSLSTPVLSTNPQQLQNRPPRQGGGMNLLPPLPSPSSLATNFANAPSYTPSPLSFAPEDYLNSKPHEAATGRTSFVLEEKKATASQSEQDAFFSNLLGSTTRYTVTS